MTKDQEGFALVGTIIDERTEVSLDDLSFFCSVRREQIVALVDEGIVEPKAGEPANWRFTGRSLGRAARAIRLQRELELDLPAVALVLDLLDQIDDMRMRLQSIRRE